MTASTAPRLDATGWLSAAAGGGLPEPGLTRWQPLRVGIVNLWEYDDAEFWFADGRMVLRGGNGAGKTKVLELTTLMLLRGEIFPAVLDPFGSQHRTMRFNLLPTGEGDDPREPADSGLGYAWIEFGRVDESGEARYFVCGLGASARRGSGTSPVNVWQFVTGLRPGKDLSLSSSGRPVEEKDLKKVGDVWVRNNAAQYRARLASELFGLDGDSYDNLTELLKQLRKPKLGERLNPAMLADTLREALPALAAHEITQLAEGWDHLELLRQAVEKAEKAATAVATFVRNGWRPWARAVVRSRADQLSRATTGLDDTTKAKRQAELVLTEATKQVTAAKEKLGLTKQEKAGKDVELRELLDSQSYQDATAAAGRIVSLRKEISSLDTDRKTASKRLNEAQAAESRARQAVTKADRDRRESAAALEESVDEVARAAAPAGLGSSAQRHLREHDVAALLSDHSMRMERFLHLRAKHATFRATETKADRSAMTVFHRREELAAARQEETAATRTVESEVETLRKRIREWAGSVSVARCTEDQLEAWCDLAAELTLIDPDQGISIGGKSVVDAMRTHIAGVRRHFQDAREDVRLRREPLANRRDQAAATLADVRAEVDSPPPDPSLWRRRQRPDVDAAEGAPLWRCVQPMGSLPAELLDLIESGLAASGLLDAWLDPTGDLFAASGRETLDTYLSPGERAPHTTLLAVLEPIPVGGVQVETIRSVLATIGWYPTPEAAAHDRCWLAADGHWRLGELSGRVEPATVASYLGATAREAARQRRIAALTAELDTLDDAIAQLDQELAAIKDRLAALKTEEEAIPGERAISESVAVLADRAQRRIDRERILAEAEQAHQQDLQQRDEAWATFAEFASAHAFPLQDLESVADALQSYRQAIGVLGNALSVFKLRDEALRSAEDVLEDQQTLLKSARTDLTDLDERRRQAELRLSTAEAMLGADQQQLLQRQADLDQQTQALADQIEALHGELVDAEVAANAAGNTLEGHEASRQAAEQTRDQALDAWWHAIDAGTVGPLGLEVPERRVVETALAGARAARRDLTPIDEDALDRSWRRCYEALETLRQELLPNRDARVTDEPESGSLPRIAILADTTSGWQPPNEAADTLAARVREQQDTFDAEQQRVLTTLLGSTFIEHLKDRLDYTAQTFSQINEKLASHPTRQGHTVRVVCEADPSDPDATAVVTALAQGYQQLVPERQEMVRAFLARKIDEARGDASADGAADWKAQLANALDYRTWLRISLQYRSGSGGSWSPFDTAKHAAKSGGEKVVLLSQPLFAAAVVAYDAASPHAPRCVWLDEAMTGVDAGIKSSFMGLTVSFQLDVMLTAHDEWCNYQTVPAVAIYDLARHPHLPGVDAIPYLWCGGELTHLDVDRLGPHPASQALDDEGLFGLLEPEH